MHPQRKYILSAFDLLLFLVSLWITLQVRSVSGLYIFNGSVDFRLPGYLWGAFGLFAAFYLFLFYIAGFYEDNFRFHLIQHLFRLFLISAVIFGLIAVSSYLTNPFQVPRSIIALFVIINFCLSFAFRYFWARWSGAYNPKRVIVIGCNDKSDRLLRELRRLKTFKAKILGVIDERKGPNASRQYVYAVLGSLKECESILLEWKPDLVILCVDDLKLKESIVASVGSRIFRNTFFYVDPSIYEIMIGRPQYLRINDMPFIRIRKSIGRLYGIKRVLDFAAAIILTSFAMIPMVIIYFLVRHSTPGPPIFTQDRVGRDGRKFKIYKFRTMYHEKNAAAVQAARQDPRITRLGKYLRMFRMDELPQFFNILKGEMSFIGPRPLMSEEVEQFKKTTPGFEERFIAMPGLSGLAQVHGEYDTKPEEKLKYDLWYCYHYSLALDFTILLRTIRIVLQRRGR